MLAGSCNAHLATSIGRASTEGRMLKLRTAAGLQGELAELAARIHLAHPQLVEHCSQNEGGRMAFSVMRQRQVVPLEGGWSQLGNPENPVPDSKKPRRGGA